MLLVCNYRSGKDTECFNYRADLNISNDLTKELKIGEPSAKYGTAKVNGKDILMIASSKCLTYNTVDQNQNCKAISSYTINFKEFSPPLKGNNGYNVFYKAKKQVNFKALLKIDKFVYFLFNTEEEHSKFGKICTGDHVIGSNSYEDTPIICSHDGLNYTVAQDAVHWNENEKHSWIFVAFSGVSSSVICRYNLTDVKAKFKESRQQRIKCPNINLMDSLYFKEQYHGSFCFNKELGLCQSPSQN
ncbi:Hypothetical predicted protein, partial [Mytilus galloprovincialis]